KGMGSGANVYVSQLTWYDTEVQRDSYVLGFAVFTAGATSGWDSYDITGILPALGDYVVGTQ
ncbi:MAG: hypothetical protein JXA42_24585, partial [Anaerolineales bacterium]|nr:hypothetical protein [Anaerolineales bacterium]